MEDSNSLGTNILEQSFNQLPAEGKTHLKDYLQNLVSLQNTMTVAPSKDDLLSSSKDEHDACKGR